MRHLLGVGILALTLVPAAASLARAESRHSGSVLAVDPGAATVVVGEVGPWQVQDGETVVVRRTFRLGPATVIVRVERRAEGAPGGWPNGFVEVPVPVTDVAVGLFVTVETGGTGRPPAAHKISIVPTGGS